MNIWITIIGMGLITYAIRLVPIVLLERFKPGPQLLQALRYVPITVLTAIFVPELLLPDGNLDISLTNARLLAGLLAIIVAWRTRSILWTIATGMIFLWLLQWVLAQ